MAYLFYYLILKPLSWFPLWFTYRISDLLFYLFFHLTGYRKKIVLDNIRGSFPAWEETQVQETAAAFYRHFCDFLVESIRMFSIPQREVNARCRVTNPELLRPYAEVNQSVILMGGHYANWEMAALAFSSQLMPHVTMGVYSPLKNPTMDRLIMGNRKRFGTRLVSRRKVQEYFDNPPPGLTADFFIGDQSPSNAKWQKLHWTPFLNRTTGFVTGGERYAVRYDRPVFYMRLRKVKRGYYEATMIPVSPDARAEVPGLITEFFARELEREINRAPAYWLWTHRRWKRGVPEAVPTELAGKDYLPGEYDRELAIPQSSE